MRPFRTLRQRRHRARKGQVAAVATIFGLLLVVSFISVFVIAPLPQQMGAIEYQHVLEVENQLSRLQATVLAQATQGHFGLALSSPVTLGSGALPPWAGPSPGSIAPETSDVRTESSYALAQVIDAPPSWNTGSACFSGGSGKCSSNGNIDTWNVTNVNRTAFTLTVTGNRNSIQYNVSGNNDTITIDWKGGDTGFVNVVVNGSDDVVIYNKGGSDTTSPVVNFYFFGQRDTFNFSPSGSHSSGGLMTLNVTFVGSLTRLCPYGNLSNTDLLGALGTGGSNLRMNVTWWNAVGYQSAPHTVTYPGGGGSNELLTFANVTGGIACAFTKAYPSTYVAQYSGGIDVTLHNHYMAPTDLAYDQGAVVEANEGGQSTMVSPPKFTEQLLPSGTVASLTLVHLVGNFSQSTGTTTSAVVTTPVSVRTVNLVSGTPGYFVLGPFYLNFTTQFPAAWVHYLATLPLIFPSGAQCTATQTFSAPYSCLAPPPGVAVEVHAALFASQVTLTTITLDVSLE